ncbi:tlg2p-like protein a [Nicotiana tabacum]|uniref:Tlg2p-like protein a n=10 Tax=Nicotiana TaxID=4085 RepID=A0AC58TUM1_TOBAC|nr:PREDICTED: syntaxin-41-like [Nicotiana sylvestris]
MAELAKAHAKALMPSFGDGKEDQRRIEALTHEITGLLKRSEKKFQRLSAAGPSEDSNVRKNVQEKIKINYKVMVIIYAAIVYEYAGNALALKGFKVVLEISCRSKSI